LRYVILISTTRKGNKMKTYSIRVTTSRNTFFEWEIEDSSAANALARITKRLKGIDIIEVKLFEQGASA
jgi:hypothetical protein